ncbi:MAG: methyltransferase domain-containing protein [Planctomycetota bacterium]|nr:methyltransferase domain-containing protein [Planctomycetota bacterium]
MAKRQRSQVERYHDRVAGLYDTIYDGDPYWEVVFQITWRHLLRHFPKDMGTRCLDVGCGTGRWGMRFAKAGYRTDFLDISRKMLDQVGGKLAALGRPRSDIFAMPGAPRPDLPDDSRPLLWHAALDDLSALPSGAYGFIVWQGDPLNCAEKPGKAFREMARLLAPGGVMAMSVDNRLQGIYHYFKDGDVKGLAEFLRTGKTNWITDDPEERYRITMFTPGQIRAMCRERGLELVSLVGKTVLPLRRFRGLLDDPGKRAELTRLEESLHAEEALFANAAHLEFIARKPERHVSRQFDA